MAVGPAEAEGAVNALPEMAAAQVGPYLAARLKCGAAGGVGACLSHVGGVPIDVVKTRIQQDPKRYSGDPLEAAQQLVQAEGVATLALGLRETATGYFVQGFLKYGLYEWGKLLFAVPLDAPAYERILAIAVSAASAELVGSAALCQFEAARIRAVASPALAAAGQPSLAPPPDAFAGLGAIYARQVPYTVCSLLTYEALTALLYGALPADAPSWSAIGVRVAAASGAAVLGGVSSQPGDTLMTVINSADALAARGEDGSSTSGDEDETIGGRVVAAELARIRGASLLSVARILGADGLFLGLRARLPHVMSIVLVQLVVYDGVREALGLTVTGR